MVVNNMFVLVWSLVLCYVGSSTAEINHHMINHQYEVFEYTNLTFHHAESPVWDPESNTFFWVDVLNQNIHALEISTMEHRVKHSHHGETNILVPITNSSRLLVASKSTLYLFDWDDPECSAFRYLVQFEREYPKNVLNEGKADGLGRFWVGTKGQQEGNHVVKDKGALYSVEAPHFIPRVHLKPVTISNGMVWSLNNTVFYYIDSETRKIEAFDFDLQKGEISGRRTIFDVSTCWNKDVIPDGLTIDSDGFLWAALMFSGNIIRIDPDARDVVEVYQLPVTQTTSLTWAGKDLDRLFVTTSKRNLDEHQLAAQPLAGAIFILYSTGTSGVPAYKFRFPDADLY